METSKGKHRGFLRRMNMGQYSHEHSSVVRAVEKREERIEVDNELVLLNNAIELDYEDAERRVEASGDLPRL